MADCTCVEHAVDPLVAASDMLVLRALELIGRRVVKLDRSRYARLGDRPFHQAHVLWQPDERAVDQGLADAWGTLDLVIAEHGCCGITADQLELILDRYVRDLCLEMQGHTTTELRYRLGVYVGV